MDDCFTKRKNNAPDTLLENLNSYHPNTKFTVQEDPSHFLDTSFEYKDGKLITKVYQKPGKLQVHWKSAIPERWKRNTILGALHCAKQIATNWQEEVKTIRQSFIKSGYPAKFVNDVIQDFDNPKSDETIIPVHWFDDRVKVGIRLPICRKNEVESKKFMRKLNTYTRNMLMKKAVKLLRVTKVFFGAQHRKQNVINRTLRCPSFYMKPVIVL